MSSSILARSRQAVDRIATPEKAQVDRKPMQEQNIKPICLSWVALDSVFQLNMRLRFWKDFCDGTVAAFKEIRAINGAGSSFEMWPRNNYDAMNVVLSRGSPPRLEENCKLL
jgi:hypothetical protein